MPTNADSHPPTNSEIEKLQKELAEIQAKRTARAETARAAELREQAKKERRELEDEEFADKLRGLYPDKEIGVHLDFLRFGDRLVGFAHNKPAHDIFIKKTSGKNVELSEARNYVVRCLLLVDDAEDKLGDAFDLVTAEFPGAPVDCANVLIELAKGGTARRRGK